MGKRNPGKEHRTIDRVINGLAEKPKLLFRDMGERIWPVLEEGKYYPHHNLYWITSDEWDLEVLGGLLLSDVAELFISTYCVRMRGNTLRFQAQYLRRIRLPRFADINQLDRARLRSAFKRRDTVDATNVALRLYGVKTRAIAARIEDMRLKGYGPPERLDGLGGQPTVRLASGLSQIPRSVDESS